MACLEPLEPFRLSSRVRYCREVETVESRSYSQKVTEKLAYNQVKDEILRLVVTDPTHLFYTSSILHCMFQTNRQTNMALIEILIFLAADHA